MQSLAAPRTELLDRRREPSSLSRAEISSKTSGPRWCGSSDSTGPSSSTV
jgi:hypothetical protein